jgi:PAS domain S-box-containing protein
VLFYAGITLDGQRIGTLVMRSDLQELESRFLGGASIMVVVMLASVVVAWLVASRLQRVISRPILNLAQVTRAVAKKADYSLRAVRQSDDEIGWMTEDFNKMLEQIQARDAQLRASEQQFRQLAESIREVFWMSDPAKERMIYVSPGYEEIWGRSCASLYASARAWVEAIHPEDRERVLQAALTQQVSGQYDEEYRIVRPDGSNRWIRDRGFPVRDEAGKVYRIAGIAEDVTERKELEKRLLEVTDRAQARIGQDIHDGLSQQLVGASFNVALLKQDLAAGETPRMERADKVAGLLDHAIAQARDLARGLYPVKLETEGLLSALQELAVNVAGRSMVSCEVECADSIAVDSPAAAMHLYRIAQEAVNNAVKHARPKRIVIGLADEREKIRLTVLDDGVGLTAQPPGRPGMGLHIMKYRATMIGGTLTIEPGVAGGTIVSCIFEPRGLKKSVAQEVPWKGTQ